MSGTASVNGSSVHWGFFCKKCGVMSRQWFSDPRRLRDIYLKAGPTFREVWGDHPLHLPTTEIEPLFFLAQHFEHELWVQCDLAELKLEPPIEQILTPPPMDGGSGIFPAFSP